MSAVPFKANADRRHHIPKQKHRVTNWAEYDTALRQRGSLTVWFTEEEGEKEQRCYGDGDKQSRLGRQGRDQQRHSCPNSEARSRRERGLNWTSSQFVGNS